MRFIAFLFFIFLSLHSYFVFAQVTDGGGSGGSAAPPKPVCSSTGPSQWVSSAFLGEFTNSCASYPGQYFVQIATSQGANNSTVYNVRCDGGCTCPSGSVWYNHHDQQGNATSGCAPDSDGDGEPDEPVESCPSGYPKVDGQCPVCIGEYNEDGTCKDDSASSAAPSSAPASAAASSVATSSGGDDDGNGDNGGGGGGNNNGGSNNGGGGSASSAASASSKAATSASSAGSSGAGQCDPTAKNYLACVGSEKMNGEQTDWEPVSANGNWLPVNENSPCVNKYQDSSGQWWCAAPTNSPSSASGACDPTSTNYASCINGGATTSSPSSAGNSSEPSQEDLNGQGDELVQGVQEDIDSQLSDFEGAYQDDIDAFVRDGNSFADEPGFLRSALISFLPVHTTCSPPRLEILGNSVDLDCYYFNVFKQAFGWFLAILTVFQIWQMAVRPVER